MKENTPSVSAPVAAGSVPIAVFPVSEKLVSETG